MKGLGCGKRGLVRERVTALRVGDDARSHGPAGLAGQYRDRFARFGADYVEAALGQGWRMLVVDPAEVDDDLVCDVTEILTSLCGRVYSRCAAVHCVCRAVEDVTGVGPA